MDIKKENVAFENSVAFIAFTGILRYVEFTGDVYQLRRDISADEFREIEQWYWALQFSWKAWQAAKAQAAEKIEALQNAVIFADECRKEWHESYMKLRKAQAVPEGFVLMPKEPTLEMVNQGCGAISYGRSNEENSKRIYKAMIETQGQASKG